MQVENALGNSNDSLETVSQYLASQLSLTQAIIGYQTVRGSHSLSLLRTQTQLNTTDSLGVHNASSNPLPLTVTVAGGNTAKVSTDLGQSCQRLLLRMHWECKWLKLLLLTSAVRKNVPSLACNRLPTLYCLKS